MPLFSLALYLSLSSQLLLLKGGTTHESPQSLSLPKVGRSGREDDDPQEV